MALGGIALALGFAGILRGASPKDVIVKPGDNVQELVERSPAGTTFHFKAGLYRGVSITPKERDTFEGEPGAILNGAQILRFERRRPYWVASGRTNPDEEDVMRKGLPVQVPGGGGGQGQGGGQGGQRGPGGGRGGFGGPRIGGFGWPGGGGGGGRRQGGGGGGQGAAPSQREYRGRCQAEYPLCIFPEDVFVDDLPVVRVQHQEELGPGRWWSDSAAGEIYVADDPAGKKVELGSTRKAFSGDAKEVTIRGLVIEKYAQPAGEAAIDGKNADNWVVDQNEVRWNHGVGIRAGNGWKVLNNKTHHNGDCGMGGNGRDILVEGNEMYKNNYAGYWPGWEAGGAKFVLTENLIIRNNFAHDNIGPGLWTDINNKNTLYEGNRTTNNTEGIFHEISFKAIIRNNTVWNDGNNTYGHHDGDAGILIGESRDVEVYGNTVTNCRAAILGRQLNRNQDAQQYHMPESYEIHNLSVHDNVVTQDTGVALGIVKPAPHMSDDVFGRWNNRFYNNKVKLGDPNAKAFTWNNDGYSEEEFRKMMKDH